MTERGSQIARSVADIEISVIKQMAIRSAAIEDAVSLAWGLPSFRTPPHIRKAVAAALEADPDIGKYALPAGVPELRKLAAAAHEQATGIAVDPDENIVVTAGNMQGMNALFHTLLDPGDEVIVTDPGFASHFQQIRLCGGAPVYWPLDEAVGWQPDPSALERLIGERTKAIVLVSPSNPTGSIFREATLRRVGEIARDRNVMIVVDDPYSHFTFENRDKLFNLASVPELCDNLAYLFTFSKAHAMSGWRLAYMVVPASLKPEILKVHDATLICAPRISQAAAIAALSEPAVHLAEFEATLARRRALICQRLDAVPHVFDYVKPEGAYYVFPRIVADHSDSFSFAVDLLERAGVSVTPGIGFGPSGEHHVRLAFCVEDETIDRAFDRIERHFGR